ncbi:glycine betaine ABC transporter substrate-binding protein [Jannaschia donghaensis]|uniref:Putative osmoprotectant uptake system substrate-binding protein OsmF n=1 Tax=Jannaschia donghaensis TaxID=420998 RepID=A0A0M6YKN0_9RHOB|nr:glycine betaine ABC transporter substrate-binding protein [Jannaschia donghaensis]CTQ50490.1 Putative osmoprotectant uptake system substrate-binding protein OsmF precursor [Jannaschia donghaensis]
MNTKLNLAAALLASTLVAAPVVAQEIVVGGKNFTEQLLLAEMTAQLLEANGFEAEKSDGLGSTVLRQAQENGQVDVYWEYTGTSLITYNEVTEKLDRDATIARVTELDAEKGLTWLACSSANNTYAFAVQGEDEATDGIVTLSDMAASFNDGNPLDVAVNAEFPRRPDGLPGVEETYEFEVGRANLKSMDSGLTYQALNEDQVDVALVFATDGRIAGFGFRVLEDDKGFFPAYSICPVVRTETLEANPGLREPLEAMSGLLTDDTMQALNAQVDVEKMSIEDVSTAFLTEQGLL